MQAAGTSDKYARLERFLDNMESVTNPDDLNEPFKTLWFRIHGLTMDDIASGKGVVFSTPASEGIEVAPSKGMGADQMKGKGRIEVVSPRDVGPTLEMVVAEKKKVTFKAASGEDLETLKLKEQAAKVMVDLQQKSAPLKGMGGEGSRLFNQIREVAILYRDDAYMDAMKKAGEISRKMDDNEFKKTLMIYLQKKIKEYQDIGGDLNVAQERFKEMAVSFKEQKNDFITLAGAVNKLCEDSIKDLISEQVVAEVEVAEEEPALPEQPVVRVPLRKRITTVKKPVKSTPELAPSPETKPEEMGEAAPEEQPEGDEVKSIIKVVKKKIVLVPEEEEEDDFTIDDIDEDIPEPEGQEETPPEEEVDETVPETPSPQEETPSLPEEVQEEKMEAGAPAKQPPETEQKPEEAPAPEKTREAADLEEAFNKIQLVYNVSLKMHNAGRDVSQLFDMITYAETVRQKGEIKTYIGVAKQLEAMLISLQSGKS